jgi:hypothetical protein
LLGRRMSFPEVRGQGPALVEGTWGGHEKVTVCGTGKVARQNVTE